MSIVWYPNCNYEYTIKPGGTDILQVDGLGVIIKKLLVQPPKSRNSGGPIKDQIKYFF